MVGRLGAAALGFVLGAAMIEGVTSKAEARVQGESAARAAGVAASAALAEEVARAEHQRAVACEASWPSPAADDPRVTPVGLRWQRHAVARALQRRESLSPERSRPLAEAIVRHARAHGLDPLLVAAVIHVESHYDPRAVSPVGARGLMQLMPATASELARRSGSPRPELFDPETNVALGTRYLAQLLRDFGSADRALVAYNAGPAAARALLRGSKAQAALDGYPRAVLTAWRALRDERNG